MKLLVFPHSHFCEKALWALDFKGIPFEPVAIMPGLHLRTVGKIAPKTTVPVLIDGDEVVQGADEIIHHLNRNHPSHLLTPADKDARDACAALEKKYGCAAWREHSLHPLPYLDQLPKIYLPLFYLYDAASEAVSLLSHLSSSPT